MSDIAIRVEGLGKRYRIGRQERYRTLRDTLVEGAQRTVRTIRGWLSRDGRREADEQTIWALKDVSFEVKRGEVLGIIGRNGAGKSTLLKILSRVTEPTEGWAEVRGRVGSLLEVGTGFHPELTGRENIYLNGAILGMKRAEIARKFDEIVAFAEVEKFIDTPVKHYSSGMYLRLAFAVAAHLEPEILLVDEVLAVGDAAFQKKCLGKMGEVAGEGRTVLFVSHNMAAIRQLCAASVLLEDGRVACMGETMDVVARYLTGVSGAGAQGSRDTEDWPRRSGSGGAKIVRVCIADAKGAETCLIGSGTPFTVRLRVRVEDALPSLVVGFELRDDLGTLILDVRSDSQSIFFGPFGPSTETDVAVAVPPLPLKPGRYQLDAWVAPKLGRRADHVRGVLQLEFLPLGLQSTERRRLGGILIPECQWTQTSVS
jgi:lipopolysaccharide transport system ATP-binding protein